MIEPKLEGLSHSSNVLGREILKGSKLLAKCVRRARATSFYRWLTICVLLPILLSLAPAPAPAGAAASAAVAACSVLSCAIAAHA